MAETKIPSRRCRTLKVPGLEGRFEPAVRPQATPAPSARAARRRRRICTATRRWGLERLSNGSSRRGHIHALAPSAPAGSQLQLTPAVDPVTVGVDSATRTALKWRAGATKINRVTL